jgi:arginine decarboxylase
MTGAIPVFLTPTRNHFGIIGPIPAANSSRRTSKKILANPFAREALAKNPDLKPRILTITQSTYDGVIYNVEMIKEMLGDWLDTLHFDEAWLPHAEFHEFYQDMHAIGAGRPRTGALVFATHSTHKLLAGISQASQIVVQDSRTASFDKHRFNEAYLMHTSTSPQYAIIASCDVAAAMMEAPGGTGAGGGVDCGSARFPPRHAQGRRRIRRRLVLQGVGSGGIRGRGHRLARRLDAAPERRWHGFGPLAEGFNMLDPIKATIVTPGLDMDGGFGETGIPAAIVTKYLAEHGIIVEKTGCTRSSSCSRSALRRAAGTRW